nr:retrovirus-related Pol polyprotein from transposon TNT 1-94 [Tanacetum cinerariifolium]
MNTKIFIDNQSTICIVKNLVFHQRTKHIEIRHHFIRDAYEKNLIQGCSIPRYWDWGRNKPKGRLTIVYTVGYLKLQVVQILLQVDLVRADDLVPAGGCTLPASSYSFILLDWFLLIVLLVHADEFVPAGHCTITTGSSSFLLLD